MTAINTPDEARKKLRKPQRIDGRAAALQLLRSLEKMNLNRDAPTKSLRAVKAAMRCGATFSSNEYDRFLRVITEWLVNELQGFGFDLNEYEAAGR
jgi:hypothetical protein